MKLESALVAAVAAGTMAVRRPATRTSSRSGTGSGL